MNRKCPACGGEKWEPGQVQSTGRLVFRPKHAKFFSLKTADIEVEGHLCLECGYLLLLGDAQKAKDLVGG